MSDFRLFVDGNVMKFKEKLMEFPKDERLDKLYFDTLGFSRFKKLASVLALVLTLSHVQASVECVESYSIQLFLNKLSKIKWLQII